MNSEVGDPIDLSRIRPVFIPSHLTRALVASGVALVATGVALLSGGYAAWEFKQVTVEEVVAFVKPPKGG